MQAPQFPGQSAALLSAALVLPHTETGSRGPGRKTNKKWEGKEQKEVFMKRLWRKQGAWFLHGAPSAWSEDVAGGAD